MASNQSEHEKGQKLDTEADTWDCPRCTLINTLDQSRCDACGGRKPKGKRPAAEDKKPMRQIRGLKHHARLPVAILAKNVHGTTSIRVEVVKREQEEEAKKEWETIVKKCKTSKTLFVDRKFSPCPSSLYVDPSKCLAGDRGSHQINWARPKDLKTDEGNDKGIPWAVFRTPRPSDICQGGLGDCWFMSALAIIAEKPELVERILITKQICNQGVYQLRLCKDGQWETVLVDDNFPCYSWGHLAYSSARRKQLWVPLIEKGFAKLHGSYQALTSGHCTEGLAALTGAPCTTIQLQRRKQKEHPVDFQLVWAQLLSSRESGFLMGASCGSHSGEIDEADYKRIGLVSSHVYSILDVQECEGNLLIRLRNPWGKFSWKGDWSDKSNNWSRVPPGKKQELMPYGCAEGIFWMCLKDFMKYFYDVEICKYREETMEVRYKGYLPINASDEFKVYNIETFDTTEVELGMFQEGSRGKGKGTRTLLDLGMYVFTRDNVDDTVGRCIDYSERRTESFVGSSTMLGPGKYLIVCAAFNHLGKSLKSAPRYTLSIHSSKLIVSQSQSRTKYLLADALIELAVTKGKEVYQWKNCRIYYFDKEWYGFVMVAENRTKDKWAHVKLDCSKSTNVTYTRKSLAVADSIPPGHRQVINILIADAGKSCSFSQSYDIHPKATPQLGGDLAPKCPEAHHYPEISSDIDGLHSPRPIK